MPLHLTMSDQRTVRFDDEPKLIPGYDDDSDEEPYFSWWSAEDFDRFQMRYEMMAQGIRSRHDTDESNPSSYTNVLLANYTSCVNGRSPSPENLKQLAGWFEVGTSRLGLESLSVRSIKKDRRKRSDHAIHSVLEAQRSTNDNDPAIIRSIYLGATRSARLFAIALADASDLAARQEALASSSSDMPSSIFSPKIAHTSLRFSMQRRLLFNNIRHPPEDQFNLPLWRRQDSQTSQTFDIT